MRTVLTLGTLALLASASSAFAHGLWLAERHGEPTLVYGHGADDDPYDPAKITAVRALDASGKEVPSEVRRHDDHATLALDPAAAVVAVTMDNGFWTERADGESVNAPKSAVADAEEAGHYVKHGLAVVGPAAGIKPLPDAPLQILPLADPLAAEPGGRLPVRVLFRGQPLAGAEVILDYVNDGHGAVTRTGDDGGALVTVRNDGLNVIAVAHEVPLEGDPDADLRQHFATLSFALAHEGE